MGTPKHKPHPKNAPGDFYVVNQDCISCGAPHEVAPELMSWHNEEHCYFGKQPESQDEVNQAIRAIAASCVDCLRYAGNDESILQKLNDIFEESQCDYPIPISHRSLKKRVLLKNLCILIEDWHPLYNFNIVEFKRPDNPN